MSDPRSGAHADSMDALLEEAARAEADAQGATPGDALAGVNPDTVDARTVIGGIQLVERKLQKALGGHGFEVVDPTGAPFDPARHEAVSTAPAASAEEDGVVAVCFQVGYVINGVVLRPARVVVKQWAS